MNMKSRWVKAGILAGIGLGFTAVVLLAAAVLGYQDYQVISTPGNPASGYIRIFGASGGFSCLTSAGANCLVAGSGNATTVNSGSVPASAKVTGTNGSSQFVAAVAADVVNLFSGCSGTLALSADGACHASGGGMAATGTASCSGGAVCTTATGSAIVTTAGTTVTFSSIPGTFNNLQLTVCGRTSRSAQTDNVKVALNGDSTAGDYNFQGIQIISTNTVTGNLSNSSGPQTGTISGNNATAGTQGCFTSTMAGYAGTTFQKVETAVGTFDAGASGLQQITLSLLWANTGAITSLVITPNVGPNFIAGSSFYLYGY